MHIWRAQICIFGHIWHIWACQISYLAIYGIFGHAKYSQLGCVWKDLAKCSSDALILGWTNLLKIPHEKYWEFKYVIIYDLKSFLKQHWRLSYEFLDFGALAIVISLFRKADRQAKETNDRGSNQLVEHVSVKQLPWPDLAIWFIRNFLTIFFLSSSRCSLHFIYFSNVFGWGYIKLSACWEQLLVQLPDNLSLHREEILVLQVMYWHTMVGALTNISGHFGTTSMKRVCDFGSLFNNRGCQFSSGRLKRSDRTRFASGSSSPFNCQQT